MRVIDKIKKKTKHLGGVTRTQGRSGAGEPKPLNPSGLDIPSVSSIQVLFPGNRIYGLRVLYTPPKPEVDIVFLHGLTGRPDKTFLDNKTGIYWPVDILPQDIPNARILSFGYDADVTKFLGPVGQNTLEDHASDLVNDLARVRGNDISVGIFPS